jgi:sulfhydrogenase subunit delta
MPPPRVAVWKLASCDGCQLTLLDCEDELLAVAGAFDLVHFLEASSRVEPGPYDVSLVEGSITSAADARRIREIRASSRLLVTIGACATSGGVQALRESRDHAELVRLIYARPEYIDSLSTSTPVSAHVPVDLELRGCPIDKRQLLEVLSATLAGRRPQLRAHAVCVECKARGLVCLTVARGVSCLGPVTHAGCGALCPSYDRGCFGCFGPSEGARPDALPGGVGNPWVYR